MLPGVSGWRLHGGHSPRHRPSKVIGARRKLTLQRIGLLGGVLMLLLCKSPLVLVHLPGRREGGN